MKNWPQRCYTPLGAENTTKEGRRQRGIPPAQGWVNDKTPAQRTGLNTKASGAGYDMRGFGFWQVGII
ncbi:MAG: hypothetical protein ACYSU3_20030 [Planctomycetota bacterium]